MKQNKFLPIVLIIMVSAVAVSGCTQNRPMTGSDRDKHGCIGSAGYSWCESKGKCLRPWEENCSAAEKGMDITHAKAIAMAGACVENGTGTIAGDDEDAFYNENSKTWWFEMRMNGNAARPGCNPACVVSEDKSSEINWRCTGAILPKD